MMPCLVPLRREEVVRFPSEGLERSKSHAFERGRTARCDAGYAPRYQEQPCASIKLVCLSYQPGEIRKAWGDEMAASDECNGKEGKCPRVDPVRDRERIKKPLVRQGPNRISGEVPSPFATPRLPIA